MIGREGWEECRSRSSDAIQYLERYDVMLSKFRDPNGDMVQRCNKDPLEAVPNLSPWRMVNGDLR